MTNNSSLFPSTTTVLASIVHTWNPEHRFTTCTLTLNMVATPHRDSRNLRGSLNMSIEFTGGQLFIEDPCGRTRPSAEGPLGHMLSLQEVTSFVPHRLHATPPWSGTRLLLLAHHIGQYRRLTESAWRNLSFCGFHPVHSDESGQQ